MEKLSGCFAKLKPSKFFAEVKQKFRGTRVRPVLVQFEDFLICEKFSPLFGVSLMGVGVGTGRIKKFLVLCLVCVSLFLLESLVSVGVYLWQQKEETPGVGATIEKRGRKNFCSRRKNHFLMTSCSKIECDKTGRSTQHPRQGVSTIPPPLNVSSNEKGFFSKEAVHVIKVPKWSWRNCAKSKTSVSINAKSENKKSELDKIQCSLDHEKIPTPKVIEITPGAGRRLDGSPITVLRVGPPL